MSFPLASLFHGDITIETGCDTALYGFGDLAVARDTTVTRNVSINGTQNGSSGAGALYIPNGGLSVGLSSYLTQNLTVMGTSYLQDTHIDTTNGGFSVTGGNSATISVGNAILIHSNTGTVTVAAEAANTIITSGANNPNAIQITATNVQGGVNVLTGATGQLQLTAGTGGLQGTTSAGNLTLTANNGSGSFTVNSSAGNQNLSLVQNGVQDSGILISAAGNNATVTAISITTTNTAGNIAINNNGGLGTGSITTLTGSGGYTLTTNTGGAINLTAQAAASSFVVNSTSSNQNLTIGVNGATNSQLILQSSGTNSTQAILIQTTNTAGGIFLTQPPNSLGAVIINTGSAGLSSTTQNGGGINLLANGASSSFINQTNADGQNLTVCVQGTTASKLILCSQGTGPQAININSTGISGGITQLASGTININTSNGTNGINIGTLIPNIPVNIGSATSLTTINGNLDVRGVTTTYESTVVTIADNILVLNSMPAGGGDAGTAIKRYQLATDTCSVGAVISDTPDVTGTAQAGSNAGGINTITLDSADTASSTDYYAGWWIRIVSGTGTCQVRRIKSYNFTTKVATVYNTADQTGVLGNPSPIEGLDWTTVPDNTSVYALYPCYYIASIWDEVLKQYSLVCSPDVSGQDIPIAHYINLQINNLVANAITAVTINGVTADIQITFNLTDNNTTPVSIPIQFNYGVYILMIRPTSSNNRCYGIFLIGRSNNASSCGQVVRIISAKGASSEQLDCQWSANAFPQIFYRPSPGVSGTTNYTVKVVTV
jgi:hypothetical protein